MGDDDYPCALDAATGKIVRETGILDYREIPDDGKYRRTQLRVYRTRFLGHTFTLRGLA